MQIIVDADLILEGVLKRSKVSPHAVDVWKTIEKISQSDLKFDEIYITNIGLSRIFQFISIFYEGIQEDIDLIMEEISFLFQIIDVDLDTIQAARKINLVSKDFESAIELVCAKEYGIDQIITDRLDAFLYVDSQDEISQFYQSKIVSHEFWLLNISYKLTLFPIESIQDIVAECKQKSEVTNITPRLKVNLQELDKHITFAKKHGGEDWGEYYSHFSKIIEKWDFYEQILDYCWEQADKKQIKYYHKFIDLWNSLNRLSDLCGHWDKRIFWLKKSIFLSENNQEWENYFHALTRLAWTFTMKYELDEAKKQLDLAHLKLHTIKNKAIIFQFFHCKFVLSIRSNDIISAENSLVEQAYLFGKLRQQKIDSKLLSRYEIVHKQDSAKLDYTQGVIEIESSNNSFGEELIKSAKNKLSICIVDATKLGWKRGLCYSQNKMADCNIILALHCELTKQKNLIEEAEDFLDRGIKIACDNHNHRRIAGYLLSWLRLHLLKTSKLENSFDQDTRLMHLEAVVSTANGISSIYDALSDKPKKNETEEIITEYRKIIEAHQSH